MTHGTRTGIFLSAALTAGLLLAPEPGIAEQAYEMKVYANSPGGRQVLDENYASAIKAAKRKAGKGGETGIAANLTLCAALTKTGQLEDAEIACTKAVTLAERRKVNRPLPLYGYDTRQQDFATALSNRGVLRAVSGDPDGAARDFRDAAKVARTAAEVSRRNLAFLEASVPEKVAMTDGKAGRD